mmetsp:Transcript_11555/g.11528  ORF Transcript_11555/g.11528 Transcript_11555/m.11528 type:complete len:123 (+) Transcript_11555:121-489(+)|eukprot:CAMPEP_0170542478 /NCGR_PEP_ID=MMETSP0211-20121228/1887_1 /TAXON_ID=311385 /ORGANISM="Pseudokeronopsis sp., Strain OXSARD2" /LENGTH=122 /DNA_ID=CAMNT_0010845545 /DNA_START=121 /DNA_END=489 /DNA_ORIENTATION=+
MYYATIDAQYYQSGHNSFAISGTKTYYIRAQRDNYITVTFEEPVLFNRMLIVFHDYDNRDYHWNGDHSLDGTTWHSFANGIFGKGAEYLKFPEDIEAKFIRIKGYNEVNDYMDLNKIELDYF